MKKIKGIKVVAFDADQTLWDFQKVMRHSLGFVMKTLEEKEPEAATMLSIDKMIEIRDRVAGELKGKTTSLEEVRLEAFRATLAYTGHPDDLLAAYLNDVYLQHRFEDIELYDDVLPTLTQLKKKYRLGLLSNGNSYPARCGLDGMFDFIQFSQEIGFEKPEPGFYHSAFEKAGCFADELLNVGDSLENDVIGPTRAGSRGVWLNRQREQVPIGTKVDYEIQSLAELLNLL